MICFDWFSLESLFLLVDFILIEKNKMKTNKIELIKIYFYNNNMCKTLLWIKFLKFLFIKLKSIHLLPQNLYEKNKIYFPVVYLDHFLNEFKSIYLKILYLIYFSFFVYISIILAWIKVSLKILLRFIGIYCIESPFLHEGFPIKLYLYKIYEFY